MQSRIVPVSMVGIVFTLALSMKCVCKMPYLPCLQGIAEVQIGVGGTWLGRGGPGRVPHVAESMKDLPPYWFDVSETPIHTIILYPPPMYACMYVTFMLRHARGQCHR